MSRECTICTSELCPQVDQALTRLGCRETAKLFLNEDGSLRWSKQSIWRHSRHSSVTPSPQTDLQVRTRGLRASIERLLRQAEEGGDFKSAMRLTLELSSLDKRIIDAPENQPREPIQVRLVYDSPIAGDPALDARAYLQRCVSDLSWKVALEIVLESMIASGTASTELERAIETVLDVLLKEKENEAEAEDAERSTGPEPELPPHVESEES